MNYFYDTWTNDWVYFLTLGRGKHLCCTCEKRCGFEHGWLEPIVTTQSYYSVGGEDGLSCGCGTSYADVETEDNGAGFWITECPNYKKDNSIYYAYIKSRDWHEKVNERLHVDGYRCQICGTAMNLTVHHITYDHLGYEPMEDLITLCRECHKNIHEADIARKARRR